MKRVRPVPKMGGGGGTAQPKESLEVGPAVFDPLPILSSGGSSGRGGLKRGAEPPDSHPCWRRLFEDPQPRRRRGSRGTGDQGEQLTGLGGEGE